MAVGDYIDQGQRVPLLERWNGARWSIETVPNPSGTVLLAVSCSSARACTAVGDYTSADTGVELQLALRWDGTAWSVQPTATPAKATESAFRGVSCPSATECIAIGSYANGSNGAAQIALAERWNGTHWSVQSIADPASAWGFGVSCSSAKACTAVGVVNYDNPNNSAWAARWTGNGWSTQAIPNPPCCQFELPSVSCPSESTCVAVGQNPSSPTPSTLVEDWDGTSWSIEPSANAAGDGSTELDSVACGAQNACEAVGSYQGAHGVIARAERWDGTRWRAQPTPRQSGIKLYAVSCPSATACIAVGGRNERWDGSHWTLLPTPTGGPAPSAISCVSATACVAVGGDYARYWNGSQWTSQQINAPQNMYLYGVSCASASDCAAVGWQYEGAELTLVEHYDGVQWVPEASPNPSGSQYNVLKGISCTSSTACTAVGYATDEILVERYKGQRWSIQTTPATGFGSSALDSVSCTATTTCTAVGNDSLAMQWNGATWSTEPAPSPGSLPKLGSVSCLSKIHCIAVGTFETGDGTTPGSITQAFSAHT